MKPETVAVTQPVETSAPVETGKKVLSIEEMLAADDIVFTEVEAWGGLVRLGSLDAGTMIDFVEMNEGPGKKTATLRILLKSLVDKDGNRIGRDDMMNGFKKKSQKTINELGDAILELNGLGKTGVDISKELRSAGTDTVKLGALSAELRGLAEAVDAAAGDPVKLKEIADNPGKAAQAHVKNA